MNYNVYFSPTGSTQRVTTFLSEQMKEYRNIDVSLEDREYQMHKDDFCIIGVPSFGGRVPDIALKRLEKFEGKRTPVLVVVTYGNRDYEDTILEMKTSLEERGFICIGAIACVCEHSIMHQFATGRPSQDDYHVLEGFMQEIKQRLYEPYRSVSVPGHYPYKGYHVASMVPQTSKECIKCGLCAQKCPVQAIPIDNPQQTYEDKCISCMRCVSICPQHARECDSFKIDILSQKLQKICSVKKDNELF